MSTKKINPLEIAWETIIKLQKNDEEECIV